MSLESLKAMVRVVPSSEATLKTFQSVFGSLASKKSIVWKEVIAAYKDDRGWKEVLHSRDPLTPKGKRWF